MDIKFLLLAGAVATLVVAGSGAADPIGISLTCTATLTAGAFAVVEAVVANPPEVLVAPGILLDLVQNFVGTATSCIQLP
jgi:hypothetical protein